jgi:hypothetical protein
MTAIRYATGSKADMFGLGACLREVMMFRHINNGVLRVANVHTTAGEVSC